ncbi:MAG: glycosyltransferase family 4 protein [Acidimicrobiia bacterium]|jgi:glycosyltransferase involved in cell wall biosynthesis
MLHALNDLGDLHVCVLVDNPGHDEMLAAASAVLPTAHVVEVPVVERPRRRLSTLGARWWPLRDPLGHIDFPAIRSSMRAAVGEDRFDVVWAGAYQVLGAPFLGGWHASVRILDFPVLIDVMQRRRAAVGSHHRHLSALAWRYVQATEAHAWHRVQKRACAEASLVTVCSDVDRELLDARGQVMVVPNGYEIPREPVGFSEAAGPATLLFQGTMSYFANSDAAAYFARDVFPLVRQRIPDAQFRIVGKAGAAVQQLAGIEGVVVVGAVKRMEDELEKAHAVVVPLLVGSGTRLKILEAWAHGIPVVSTTVGAEGLPVSQGDNVLLADSTAAIAEACIRVLTDEGLRTRLADAGRRTVEANFDWADIEADFLAAVRSQLQAQRIPEDRP